MFSQLEMQQDRDTYISPPRYEELPYLFVSCQSMNHLSESHALLVETLMQRNVLVMSQVRYTGILVARMNNEQRS